MALKLPYILDLSLLDIIDIVNIGLKTSFVFDSLNINFEKGNNKIKISFIYEELSLEIDSNYNCIFFKNNNNYSWDKNLVVGFLSKKDFTLHTGDTINFIYGEEIIECEIETILSKTYKNINQTIKTKNELNAKVTAQTNNNVIMSGDTVTLALNGIWDIKKI